MNEYCENVYLTQYNNIDMRICSSLNGAKRELMAKLLIEKKE